MLRPTTTLFYALLLPCVLATAGLWSSASWAAIKVEVQGLPKPLEKNVRANLNWQNINPESLSSAYLQQRLMASEQQVAEALQPFGYYQAKISSELLSDQPKSGDWLSRYQIDLGPPTVVNALNIHLTEPPTNSPALAELAKQFPLQPGQRLIHSQYEQGKTTLSSRLNQLGYLDAELTQAEVAVSRQRNSADITLRWNTGPAYRFGELAINAPEIEPRLLRRWAEFSTGDAFDYAKLLSFQRKLNNSGFFAFSQIEINRVAETATADIVVNTAPAAKRLYKASFGYGTDTGARAQLGFEQRWLNRYGHSLLADLRLAEREQSYSMAYRIPALRGRADSYTISWQQRDQQLPEYDSRSSRFSVTELSHTRQWQIQHSANVELDDFVIGSTRTNDTLWYLETHWSRFSSNRPVFPNQAQSLTLNARLGSGFDQAQQYLARLQLQYLKVLPAPWDGRVLLRATAGALTVDNFDQLAPQHRFYAGGDRSVRGYRYQSLAPTNSSGDKIGGHYLAELSLETDYRFANNWAVAGFIDAGQAFSDTNRSDNSDIAVGTGLGLRFITTLLLVRLDVANGITESGQPWRLHLSLGTDF